MEARNSGNLGEFSIFVQKRNCYREIWVTVNKTSLYVGRGVEENGVEWTGKAETKTIQFLAVSKARNAVFWPAAGLKEGKCDGFGVWAEGTSLTVFVV